MVRDTPLAALVDEFVWQRHRADPVRATADGVHEFAAKATDLTATGIAEREALADRWLARFTGVSAFGLSQPERTDRALLMSLLQGEQALRPFAVWRRQPSLYSDSIVEGAFGGILRTDGPEDERLGSLAERLAQAPAVLAAARENLDPTLVPPLWCDVALAAIPGGAALLRGLVPQDAPAESPAAGDLATAAAEAASALEAYAGWIRDELAPKAGGSFVVGREIFDRILQQRELVAHDAETLDALGEDLAAETEAALAAAAKELGDDDWRDTVVRLRRDHPAADELLGEYRDALNLARDAATVADVTWFPPGESIVVEETPAFARPTHPFGSYLAPAAFGDSKKGRLWLTVPGPRESAEAAEDRLSGHPRAAIPIFACHEGYPGHHLHLAAAAVTASNARRVFRSDVFVEGWGLYVEELMADLGFLDDPATRVLRLQALLWRAVRVRVDVGLATGALSASAAVQRLVEGARLPRPTAIAEVRRHTLAPLQASSYVIGRSLITALRDSARSRIWGMREFHDRLLATGAPPLRLVASELGL